MSLNAGGCDFVEKGKITISFNQNCILRPQPCIEVPNPSNIKMLNYIIEIRYNMTNDYLKVNQIEVIGVYY